VQLSELDFIYEEHDAVLQEEQMENRKQAKVCMCRIFPDLTRCINHDVKWSVYWKLDMYNKIKSLRAEPQIIGAR